MARSLAQVQATLALWYAADDAAAAGKSYTIDNRQLTRQDAAEIARRIASLEAQERQLLAAAAGGTARASLANFNH